MDLSQSNRSITQIIEQILVNVPRRADNQPSDIFTSISDTQNLNISGFQLMNASVVKDNKQSNQIQQLNKTQQKVIGTNTNNSPVKIYKSPQNLPQQNTNQKQSSKTQKVQTKSDQLQQKPQEQEQNKNSQNLNIGSQKLQKTEQHNKPKVQTNTIAVNTEFPHLTFNSIISTSIQPTIIVKQQQSKYNMVAHQPKSNLSNEGLSQSVLLDSTQYHYQPNQSKNSKQQQTPKLVNHQSLQYSQSSQQKQKRKQKRQVMQQPPISLSPDLIAKSTTQRQLKQHYLRQQILQPGYEPQQFILFLNSKLPIDSDVDKCTLQQLQSVVQAFIAKKKQQKIQIQNYYSKPSRDTQIPQPSICRNTLIKQPAKIIIRSYPQVMEQQYYNSLKCIKIEDKYQKVKISCQVNNPQRKHMGGILGIGGTSFLCFQVWVYGLSKQPVLRRYSDFIWLRNILLKFYPSQIIPPIPNKKASKRLPRQILKRMRILTFFLNDIVKMPILLNNKFVEGFLLIKQLNKFQKLKQQGDKKKSYQSMLSTQTLTGKVQLELSDKTIKYKQGITKLVPQVERLYKQITRNSKKMKALTVQKINMLYSMADQFGQLFQISTRFNCYVKSQSTQKLSQIYAVLNNMMAEWGNTLKKQIDDVEKNMCTFFKYVREQFMGYKQLLQKTRLAQQNWIRQKDSLDRHKQKIFQLRDPKKWQLNKKDIQNFPKSAIYDRNQAFKIMLPKQSVQVQNLKQNYSFYLSELFVHGNQNFVRNIDRYCDNFGQFSIKMKVSNQQVGAVWTQISQKFADPFRKKHTIRLMQKQMIGEDNQNPTSGVYDD